MCRPNCLPRSCLLTSQKTTQRVAKAVDPSATAVEVQHPPVTLSMSSTTSAWLAKKALVRRITGKLSHRLRRHRLTEYDGDLVGEFVSLRQRQQITAPELARVEPAGVFLGGQQAHLLVGDRDGLSAVGGLQPVTLVGPPPPGGLANSLVQEWNTSGPIRRCWNPAAKPAPGQPRGAGERRAVHPGDHA